MMDFKIVRASDGYRRVWFSPSLPAGVSPDQYIGSRLKELRQRFGLTRAQISSDCGLSERTLEAFEQGRRSVLSASFYNAFCYARALCLPLDVLFCLCDPSSDDGSIPDSESDSFSL